MKVLLILMLSTGVGGASYDTIPVNSVDECRKTASTVIKYMATEGYITTFRKHASFLCIDANTGKELVKRTIMNKKGQPK